MNTSRHADERRHVADVIRSERLQRGLSVGEAAQHVGVAPSAWSRWETSTSLPRPRMMRTIGAVLGLPDDWMVPPGMAHTSGAGDLGERLTRIEERQREILEQMQAKDRRIEELQELMALRREIGMLLDGTVRDGERRLGDAERRDPEESTAETIAENPAETDAVNDAHLRDLHAPNDLNAEQIETLRLALVSRDLMGQAKGVIMASMACSPDEAFQLIAKQSQHQNRKVTDVAAEIVQRIAARQRPAVTPDV